MIGEKIVLFGDTSLGDSIELHLELNEANYIRITDISNYEEEEALSNLGFGKGEIGIVFVLMESLENNIFLILSIRAIDGDVKILTKADSEGDIQKLKLAGADEVLSYNQLTSYRIFNLIAQPNSTLVLDNTIFTDEGVQMFESLIDGDSKYLGKDISKIEMENSLLIGAINTKGDFIFSKDNYILQVGDILIIAYE
ncbi:MAG TPA: hypothetical protein EYO61_03460 [Campylobacterales bacterium]|nr:hypothetical protein [Campylobacterales bacterium]